MICCTLKSELVAFCVLSFKVVKCDTWRVARPEVLLATGYMSLEWLTHNTLNISAVTKHIYMGSDLVSHA
jgi:hypothetical protein